LNLAALVLIAASDVRETVLELPLRRVQALRALAVDWSAALLISVAKMIGAQGCHRRGIRASVIGAGKSVTALLYCAADEPSEILGHVCLVFSVADIRTGTIYEVTAVLFRIAN